MNILAVVSPIAPNRLWRGLATALAFFVFGAGGLVLGLLAYPAIALFRRDLDRRRSAARALTGGACGFFIGLMRTLGLLQYRYLGEPASAAQGALIIANHPSLIDVLFLIYRFPQADCVVKSRIWHHPATRWAVRCSDYIPNTDTAAMLAACEQRLRAGRQVIMFPEGTRTAPGAGLAFRRGPALVALKAGARIVPVAIRCHPSTLTRGEPWYRIPPTRVDYRFTQLPAVAPSAACSDSRQQREHSQAVTRQLETLIATAQ